MPKVLLLSSDVPMHARVDDRKAVEVGQEQRVAKETVKRKTRPQRLVAKVSKVHREVHALPPSAPQPQTETHHLAADTAALHLLSGAVILERPLVTGLRSCIKALRREAAAAEASLQGTTPDSVLPSTPPSPSPSVVVLARDIDLAPSIVKQLDTLHSLCDASEGVHLVRAGYRAQLGQASDTALCVCAYIPHHPTLNTLILECIAASDNSAVISEYVLDT
ncbi:hypothetical protein KIPB_006533 [Kipferlia bialata]|uniref:Ribosomal protein L7Ae/L30e/S12e/Gadd45 domain-containing protein n=1 Tax=Kipferlia bialata TaxID=797122 RepID=A0A391P3A0_9EUKA|nr:hypothetical protein KIPB_006533 [Kipferlia bialata]|eukprot:g6533.t1